MASKSGMATVWSPAFPISHFCVITCFLWWVSCHVGIYLSTTKTRRRLVAAVFLDTKNKRFFPEVRLPTIGDHPCPREQYTPPHILGAHTVSRPDQTSLADVHDIFKGMIYNKGPYHYSYFKPTGSLQTETFKKLAVLRSGKMSGTSCLLRTAMDLRLLLVPDKDKEWIRNWFNVYSPDNF